LQTPSSIPSTYTANDETYQTELEKVQTDQTSKGVTEEDDLLYYKLRLWIPDSNDLRQMVAEAEHESKVAGHSSQDKTLELRTRHFFFPSMDKWVMDYVRSCDTCQKIKSLGHAKYGLPHPLELAYTPWSSISMDLITQLPKTKGNLSIWVVVDRCTKMANFIPFKEPATAEDLAKVFVQEIWRLHSVPPDIISNRDTHFTSNFWQEVLPRLGIRPRMRTSLRPQTDGQTEKVNQSVELYVRTFCNYEQDDWTDLLPLAEYAYNNSVTQGTGLSPILCQLRLQPPDQLAISGNSEEPSKGSICTLHQICTRTLRQGTRESTRTNGKIL
jgi:hypothetical protein